MHPSSWLCAQHWRQALRHGLAQAVSAALQLQPHVLAPETGEPQCSHTAWLVLGGVLAEKHLPLDDRQRACQEAPDCRLQARIKFSAGLSTCQGQRYPKHVLKG